MTRKKLLIQPIHLSLAAALLLFTAHAATAGETGAFAERIFDAWRAGEEMPQLSVAHPDADLATGYAVQRAFTDRITAIHGLGGYKAAVVGASGQENLGTDGPITGIVPASGIHHASENITIDLAAYPNRAIETEIGYTFSKAIGKPLESVAELKKHVKAVMGIIEVPGGLTEETQPGSAADLAAWNVNARDLIVGPPHEPDNVDIDTLEMSLYHNGTRINNAHAGDAAGGQWMTLLKTVNNLAERGYTIEPGHVVTNGALGKILKAQTGLYQADYGPLGSITFHAMNAQTEGKNTK
jgi:2-oxo-hept-3-ene-1,7-dioate hydratase